MSWQGIHGHDDVAEKFRRGLQQNRLASTFLFAGPPGIGKRMFAQRLAKALLCDRHDEAELRTCGQCPSCQQVDAASHPDLEIVSKPADRASIPVALFIGAADHRMREGLCHWISLRPSTGKRRIAIIDDADLMQDEAANCLLKTLEEPPRGSLLILISTGQQRQLPTIRSRCQLVRFQPLDDSFVQTYVMEQGLCQDPTQAAVLAQLSGGSLQNAAVLAEEKFQKFLTELFTKLADRLLTPLAMAKLIQSFVDGYKRDSTQRREALSRVVDLFVMVLHHQMRYLADEPGEMPEPLRPVVRNLAAEHGGADPQSWTLAALDRTLATYRHINANAHLSNVIEAWMDDLWRSPLQATL